MSSAEISPKAGASTNRTERPGEAERTDSEMLVRHPPNEADQATESLTPTNRSGSGNPVTATDTEQAESSSSSSTQEEKRDRSKEEPLEIKQEEGQWTSQKGTLKCYFCHGESMVCRQ